MSREQRDFLALNPEKAKAKASKKYRKWRAANPKIIKPILTTEEGRFCRACHSRKPPNEFNRDAKNKQDGLEWRCRDCANEATRRWQKANPHRVRLKGSTKDLRLTMWTEQGGKCDICSDPIELLTGRRLQKAAHLDHCHETGTLRSLLCGHCNVGLGSFKDDRKRLLAAISYLDRYA